jgi:hypothetical protein
VKVWIMERERESIKEIDIILKTKFTEIGK